MARISLYDRVPQFICFSLTLCRPYAEWRPDAGQVGGQPDIAAINNYVDKVGADELKPLDFTIYMPAGYDNLSGKMVPNIVITDDPAKILTASFVNGQEVWPEARLLKKIV